MKVKSRAHERILIVDDHPLFCDAMAMTVSEIFNQPRIETASDLHSALARINDSDPFDCIVLDLNLPDTDGIDGLIRLHQLVPECRLVVVSSFSDNRIIASVLEAGASGFVPKDSPREELITAFQIISDGGTYTPPDFHRPTQGALDQSQYQIVEKLKTLTPQQAKILSLICEGKLNKQIAYELSIVETTVKAHLTAILRKLGVQNRTQAVLLAKKVSYNSLIETTDRLISEEALIK